MPITGRLTWSIRWLRTRPCLARRGRRSHTTRRLRLPEARRIGVWRGHRGGVEHGNREPPPPLRSSKKRSGITQTRSRGAFQTRWTWVGWAAQLFSGMDMRGAILLQFSHPPTTSRGWSEPFGGGWCTECARPSLKHGEYRREFGATFEGFGEVTTGEQFVQASALATFWMSSGRRTRTNWTPTKKISAGTS